MRVLLPYLALYRRHWFLLSLGIVLAIATLLASIGLLTLSGWFLAGTAIAGIPGITFFNYMLPAAGVRGAAISRTAGRYAERLVSHSATFRVLKHLRVFAFEKILPLTPGGIARFRQGELLNRLVGDVETLDHLYLRVISPIVSALVVIAVLTFGLGFLDQNLAYVLGGFMTFLLFALPVVFYRAGKPIGIQLTTLRAQYRTLLTSALQGQAELTVFGAQYRFRDQLAEIEQRWLIQQQRQAGLTGMSQAIIILATGCAVALMLWLASGIQWPYRESGAIIALFVFCALAAFEALGPVAVAFQHLGQVMTSAERVSQIVDTKPEVTFPDNGPAGAEKVSVTLSGVGFTYPGQPLPVLQDVSLTLRAGEHIALLGKTGCGKSTLLQLITRAWDVSEGKILINDKHIADYDEHTLRSLMAVVPQRIHVFNNTLRANLHIGDMQATDTQLNAVLSQVGLDNLLDNDQGLNGWLGEGGRQLSGGEQRRLGIARALLHNAPFLLLDEPTEGLDADTEQHILALLRDVGRNRTMLIITHRLQGLEHMDTLCVMDDGQIAEQGTHDALLARRGRYYQFVNRLPAVTGAI
ncbi:cysteine/glutathione ABC transporter ATP-binding protein/permease CydC [Morganella psychrotolerans]|uniref:Glutathione/L-cysteine transport system ATP-binding/permease protein CydC n=1 Tax=Morganella psychrotolerans TaxID=368603 RepID=A0A5M9R8D4_9GAMM|nr:cysteine/glutathione ABC transporter ATP-binding protein/permease CydC [Morganella psychrotolerans]KAA8716549.1 cysteine/glutathione ABC transporter ATP-binding protein/permease CydC [Morganella psychrotolerans]OBU09070.1 cysteine/glutathione ABC transporter ATP-binding protein/permease CydC [Morganella psychrotolerans]